MASIGTRGTSYIGGLPARGDQPWPRGPQGQPLHFMAQIDLADITAHRPDTGLPEIGFMVFFVYTYTNDNAVLHVPPNATIAEPPKDKPPLHGDENFAYVYKFAPSVDTAPRILPRWPLSFHPAPHEEGEESLGIGAEHATNAIGRVTDKDLDRLGACTETRRTTFKNFYTSRYFPL